MAQGMDGDEVTQGRGKHTKEGALRGKEHWEAYLETSALQVNYERICEELCLFLGHTDGGIFERGIGDMPLLFGGHTQVKLVTGGREEAREGGSWSMGFRVLKSEVSLLRYHTPVFCCSTFFLGHTQRCLGYYCLCTKESILAVLRDRPYRLPRI